MFENEKIAFIGTGTMGEAMIAGLIRRQLIQPERITGSNPLLDRNEMLRETYGIEVTDDNIAAVLDADVVVLSVKPQVFPKIVPDLRGRIKPEALVLSIIAGLPIEAMVDNLLHGAVARAMPNTPAQIGQGVTVWTATEAVSPRQLEQARAIFSCLGSEHHAEDESYLDMATALSGTGPAYIFIFMEAMIDAGVHMGFSRRVAKELVIGTIRGSLDYAEQSGLHEAELRNQVTSPGGTTAEAIYHLDKGNFRTTISRAIWAAYQRSVSLGAGQLTKGPNSVR
jgi:pyrroline-5-carboxylate reductase